MKPQMKFRLAVAASLLVAVPVMAQTPMDHMRGEFMFQIMSPNFSFSEANEPNSYWAQRQSQMCYPGMPDEAYMNKMKMQSYKSMSKMGYSNVSDQNQAKWRFLGPSEMTVDKNELSWDYWPWGSAQGRLTDLAISQKHCDKWLCRLYVGSAAGGLWMTHQALAEPHKLNWKRIGHGLGSGNIGAITIDPNDPKEKTLYVGTGEHNFNFSSAAGNGLYKSKNGGKSFRKVPTMIVDPEVSDEPIDFTLTRGISAVAIHPHDPKTIYVTTTTAALGLVSVRGGQSTITGGPQGRPGLYKTTNGGATWTLEVVADPITFSSDGTPEGIYEITYGGKDVRFDPQDPSIVYASILQDGLYRSAPSIEGGDASFKRVFTLQDVDGDEGHAAFDVTVKNGKTRIYLYNGATINPQSGVLYRLDDAGVPADQLTNGVTNSANWLALSSSDINNLPSFISNNVCSFQCTYDLFVESPKGHPDTVYLGGNFTKITFNPVLRSTDAGVTFTADGYDLSEPTNGTHVDVRALVFNPENPDQVFVAGDGGLTRTNGYFGDGKHLCTDYMNKFGYFVPPGSPEFAACEAEMASIPEKITFMNDGLTVMQYYNIAGDPRQPLKRLIAGAQDNATQMYDANKNEGKKWSLVFQVGDGTSASGFHNTDPNILFASFQSNFFFTNFRSGGKLPGFTEDGFGNAISYQDLPVTASWSLTSGPILVSGELDNPTALVSGRQFITMDPKYADTQFTGFESVWRTTNNGGDKDFLEENCTVHQFFFTGTAPVPICGDWEPLGQKLTSDVFGDDSKTGGVVVAAERSAGDEQTMWAGTSLGRLFISKNVNESDATAVEWVRLDESLGLPQRFVSGIAVSKQNPNVAFVTFSGFSEVEPGAHVYRVKYNPATKTATAKSLDKNLPDYPVNHIVRDDLNGDLYISNDFGVLRLAKGDKHWKKAGRGLPMVLVPHMEIHPKHRTLLIGTHGLGAWALKLPKLDHKKKK